MNFSVKRGVSAKETPILRPFIKELAIWNSRQTATDVFPFGTI